MNIHVTRPFDFNCAKKHWFRAAKNHASSRKKYNFSVAASYAIPKLPVAAEPTNWKENWITFDYTAETATRSFANYVQEWNEYDIYVNSAVAKTTRPFDTETKPKKEYNCAAQINEATAWNLNHQSLLNSPFR